MNTYINQRKSHTSVLENTKDKYLYSNYTNEKIKIFGKEYEVIVCFQSISNPTLNLKMSYIEICFPKMYKKYKIDSLISLMIKKMYKKIAENELDFFMDKARHTFGFAPDDYTVVDLNRPLATVIDKSEILFSSNIVKYDKKIIEYVVFHEFCHLKYKNHTKRFYELLEKYYPNYNYYASKLGNASY